MSKLCFNTISIARLCFCLLYILRIANSCACYLLDEAGGCLCSKKDNTTFATVGIQYNIKSSIKARSQTEGEQEIHVA